MSKQQSGPKQLPGIKAGDRIIFCKRFNLENRHYATLVSIERADISSKYLCVEDEREFSLGAVDWYVCHEVANLIAKLFNLNKACKECDIESDEWRSWTFVKPSE